MIVDHALGAGFPLFIILPLGALALTLAWEHLPPRRQNLWIFALVLFFTAMIAVCTNGFVTFLNILAVACARTAGGDWLAFHVSR